MRGSAPLRPAKEPDPQEDARPGGVGAAESLPGKIVLNTWMRAASRCACLHVHVDEEGPVHQPGETRWVEGGDLVGRFRWRRGESRPCWRLLPERASSATSTRGSRPKGGRGVVVVHRASHRRVRVRGGLGRDGASVRFGVAPHRGVGEVKVMRALRWGGEGCRGGGGR